MSTYGDNGEMLAALHRLLDAWGGDKTRWPSDVRRQIEDLLQRVPEARQLLAEARAIDRALDMAAEHPVPVGPGLADRIVLAAAGGDSHRREAATTRSPAGGGRVIQLRRREAGIAAPAERHESDPMPSRARWQAAALMAASLIAGIYLGGSVNLTPVLYDFAASLGVSTGVEGSELALGEEIADGEAL